MQDPKYNIIAQAQVYLCNFKTLKILENKTS